MVRALFVSLLLFRSVSVLAISPEEFATLQQIGHGLLQFCPPAQCLIIGIGRSPTPVHAYFSGFGFLNNYFWNIPLTAFRYGTDSPDLALSQRKQVFEHFGRYAPPAEVSKGKRLVLVDFAGIKGQSLISAQRYLGEFLLERGTDRPLEEVAIVSESLEPHLMPEIKKVIAIRDEDPLLLRLKNEKYDDQAPYGSYSLTQPGPLWGAKKAELNPKFKALISEIKIAREDSSAANFPQPSARPPLQVKTRAVRIQCHEDLTRSVSLEEQGSPIPSLNEKIQKVLDAAL